ncbi:thiamine pyrophosphate-dependent enzyme [Salipiger profundus]|uniref:thiamine pyrophosphate-dependent enzyme n=1 Tax=Salipiger profundus TaxID=1229727 RepID=UPI001A9609D0|nr:thiamine pyrophosphate-dependent enzyme [Salipiger profundus]
MTGGSALATSLSAHGVDRIFCVPGESFLGLLDALESQGRVQVITTRHEGGAGFMALADARLTGKAGVAMVSRGPGCANATIAVQTAQEDAVPFILLVGQVERRNLGRDAFQEVDYGRTFSALAKAVIDISDPDRAAEQLAQAFQIAQRGLPGPVVVTLPEDMLDSASAMGAAPVFGIGRPDVAGSGVTRVAEALATAERPLLLAGSALRTSEGRKALRRIADRWQLPVVVSSRQADLLENTHSAYAGQLAYGADPKIVEGYKAADLMLAIGTRLGDVTSQGYSFPAAPVPQIPLHHVHMAPEAIGTLRTCESAILSDCAAFLDRLAELAPDRPRWIGWRDRLHTDWLWWSNWAEAGLPDEAQDGVVFGAVIAELARQLPPDAVVTSDAGNFGAWLGRFLRLGSSQTFLGPMSGAMGYGVPAAVAASLRHPHRRAICIVGDGGMMMTGAELATASAAGATPIIIVSDNGAYGTIRMHQERRHPGQSFATSIGQPDFAGLARAMGAGAHVVQRPDEIAPAIAAALADTARPSLLHVRTSLQYISPLLTLSRASQAPEVVQ